MSKFTVREIPRFMLLFITLNENIWKKMHRITLVLRQLQENGAALTPESVLPSPRTIHDITLFTSGTARTPPQSVTESGDRHQGG